MNNNHQHFNKIKHSILSPYPTTIRRSICISNIIAVDHSVNRWLFERWLATGTVDNELNALQLEMACKIQALIKTPELRIEFVHLDPRITNHPRASY